MSNEKETVQLFFTDESGEQKLIGTMQAVDGGRTIESHGHPIGAQVEETSADLNNTQIASGIATLDGINRAVLKHDPFAEFLYRLNMANLRSGKAVPRPILVQSGITKQGLKRLIKDGYITETRLNVERYGSVPCYTVAEGVTFVTDEDGAIRVERVAVEQADKTEGSNE